MSAAGTRDGQPIDMDDRALRASLGEPGEGSAILVGPDGAEVIADPLTPAEIAALPRRRLPVAFGARGLCAGRVVLLEGSATLLCAGGAS